MNLPKLAGPALVAASLAIVAAGGAVAATNPVAEALWTALPVFVAGVTVTAFARIAGHVRSIDRAVSAQYVLLRAYREERAAAHDVEPRRLARR